MDVRKLEEVILDQLENFRRKDPGTRRDIDFEKYLKTKQITVISGVRRSGKSTLLRQFSEKFENFYYINFDDERLINFTVDDFDNLMVAFRKMSSADVLFLDEVQNIEKWERFVRRVFDEGYKIFLTGSNAKLLSSELSTHLTGRYFKLELYPFSFAEYLDFNKLDNENIGSKKRARILKYFDDYLQYGGFPEFIKYKDKEFVNRAYEDILHRDLLIRFHIRETKSFKQLAAYLFANFTKELSYNSLKNVLGFKSVMSVKNYIEFMQESYLLFELYKYDFSLKKQYVSDKKIYVIDNGMRNTVAFSFSEDKGKLLENLIFLELKRRGKEIYYFKNKNECDFLVKEKNKIVWAAQVTTSLDKGNEQREVDGLLEAMDELGLKQGVIITMDEERELKFDGKKIEVIPAWKWILREDEL